MNTPSISESVRQEVRLPIPSPPQKTICILVVEDARCIQKRVSIALQEMGIHVELADNGKTACEMAENSKKKGKPYDLILMDIQMPVMKGCEATKWLREHGWDGPIVAVSASPKESILKQALEGGCDDYVIKPLRKQSFQTLLATHLRAKTDQ